MGKRTPSAQGLKDKCLLLLSKCQTIARMSSPPCLPLREGSPGSFLEAVCTTCYRGAIIPPWEAGAAQGGVPRKEGEGRHWDHRGKGMVFEPSTWSEGKGCFVIFGLNFQSQNRKCPLGLGAPGRNVPWSPLGGGLPWSPRLEFKAPSEFWYPFPPYSFP